MVNFDKRELTTMLYGVRLCLAQVHEYLAHVPFPLDVGLATDSIDPLTTLEEKLVKLIEAEPEKKN